MLIIGAGVDEEKDEVLHLSLLFLLVLVTF
jgi:hypothetical protein